MNEVKEHKPSHGTLYEFELTDTFSGEANYSWVRRFKCYAQSELAAVRMAKKYFGYGSELRRDGFDTWRYRKGCIVMFLLSL